MTFDPDNSYRLHTGTRWMLSQAVRRDQEAMARDTSDNVGRTGCRRTIAGNYMIFATSITDAGKASLGLGPKTRRLASGCRTYRPCQTELSKAIEQMIPSLSNSGGVVSTSGGDCKFDCNEP